MSKILDTAKELVKYLEELEKDKKVQLKTLEPGDTFMIGEHPFIVLEQDCFTETTKVISKNFMAEDVKFGDGRDYRYSNLREVIEKEIQPIIEQEVGEDKVLSKRVCLTSVDKQCECSDVICKVRPITFEEARDYNDLLVNCDLNDTWWTCTPWSTEKRGYEYSIAAVFPSGVLCNNRYYYSLGVRPFCILNSNIFVSKGEC